MAISDIYETGFDEDVQTDSSANYCPECDGRVTTNAVETVCEDCCLVIDEQRIDHGPEWRAYDNDEIEFVLVGGYAISQFEMRFSTGLNLVIAPNDYDEVVRDRLSRISRTAEESSAGLRSEQGHLSSSPIQTLLSDPSTSMATSWSE